jgi:uncharacterized protein YktA (UPF0223 family)
MTNAVGDVTLNDDGDLKIMTNNGLQTIMSNAVLTAGAGINNSWVTTAPMNGVSAATFKPITADDLLEKYEFNQFVVEHKVQEQELLKLKEENVNYADEIKEQMAKNCAREFIKKLTFSKKHDVDTSTHSFRGRVWVFTREELVNLIEDVKKGNV